MNLGGMPFQIDDEAFEKLNAYLKAVKRKFSHVQGNEEIVEDIEARVAEMFQENLNSTSRKIVSIKDVDGAIEAMGKPEEFEQGFQEEDYTDSSDSSSAYSVKKRLYRDPEDKVLGGVISGLSQYFGLESPTLLRVIWAALPILDIFMGGISTSLVFLAYVVLWIAVPKALTATQKMQMRGEPVNLDNIQRKFGEGVDDVKKNLGEDSSNRNARGGIGEVLGFMAEGFGKLLLVFGLFIAGMIVLGLILGLFGAIVGLGAAGPFLSASFFGNTWMGWTLIIGTLLMLVALPIFLISLFIKLLFKTKTNMPALAFGTLGAFILGLILTTVSGINFSKEFSNSSTVKETMTLQPASEFYLFGSDDSDWGDDDFTFGVDEALLKENVDLKIIDTRDSLPSLEIKKKAKGRNSEAAKTRAENIGYSYDVKDNSLTFSEVLEYSKNDRWRNQSVDAILRIPENTTLHFDESLRGVLREAEIHGKDYHSWSLIDHGVWKYVDGLLVGLDEEGNPVEIDEDDSNSNSDDSIGFRWEDGNTYIDVDEDSENLNIRLFGKEVFKLDVTERDGEGEAKRVSIKVGDKEPIEIEVDEDGESIRIE